MSFKGSRGLDEGKDASDFESNLQPIDMSVFDSDSDDSVAEQFAVPVIGASRPESEPEVDEGPAVAAETASSEDDGKQEAATSSASASSGSTGEAAPLNERIDMAAIAAMGTSQFMAAALGEAAAAEAADPFAPKPVSAFAEDAEVDVDNAASEAVAAGEMDAPEIVEEAEPEPAASDEPAVDPEESSDEIEPAAEEEPAQGSLEVIAPDESAALAAAAYSRDSGNYEHRRGWAALSTAKKRAIVIVVVLAMLLGVAGGVLLAIWQNVRDAAMVDNSIVDSLAPVEEDIDPYWMLILGSDSRAEDVDRARSDVIMLCRIDPQKPQVTMVSIPRDTRVHIEGYGTQKINAAYALGGAELAIKVVSEYAGVDISHYAEIYFTGLEDLVDQLGGVTIDVPEHCKYSDVELQPGVQTLSGHEALIFARCRKTYSRGDFTRTMCQRMLVQAMVEKILAQPASTYPSILQGATQCFSTDIPLEDLIALATKMQGMKEDCFYSAMCPSYADMVGGVSYTFSYINQWKLMMQRADNGEDPALDEEEEKICGYSSTLDNELDMTVPLSEEVQANLQAYWDEQAALAAAEKQKELEAQSNGGKSSDDSSEGTETSSK